MFRPDTGCRIPDGWLKMKSNCMIPGCQAKAFCKEMCSAHYQMKRKYGRTETIKHGLSYSPEYSVWADMKQRCYNQKHSQYKNYGGRGILVCDRWVTSFMAFYNDMGAKPASGQAISLDRIDNDGNYGPGNCRWTNQSVQVRNQRIRSSSRSGVPGVCWHKKNENWQAQMQINGVSYHMGSYKDFFEAVCARKSAEIKHGYWRMAS